MPAWDDLEAGLKEAGRAIDALPAGDGVRDRVHQRVLASGRARATRARVLRTAVPLVGLALVAAFFFWRPTPAPSPRIAGGFTVVEASADLSSTEATDGTIGISQGSGTLVDAPTGSRFAVSSGARLGRRPSGVQIFAGTVEVQVAPQPPGSPVRIQVSGGFIDVLGTRFTVVQKLDSGQVTLHDGHIRFVDGEESVDLIAGQTLNWPRPAAPAKPDEDPLPSPVLPVRKVPQESREVFERVGALRVRGQFAEAVAELEAALRRPAPQQTRERLSFELGSILSYQLKTVSKGCAHWKAHRRTFRGAGYAAEIEQARKQLGCADEGD